MQLCGLTYHYLDLLVKYRGQVFYALSDTALPAWSIQALEGAP